MQLYPATSHRRAASAQTHGYLQKSCLRQTLNPPQVPVNSTRSAEPESQGNAKRRPSGLLSCFPSDTGRSPCRGIVGIFPVRQLRPEFIGTGRAHRRTQNAITQGARPPPVVVPDPLASERLLCSGNRGELGPVECFVARTTAGLITRPGDQLLRYGGDHSAGMLLTGVA